MDFYFKGSSETFVAKSNKTYVFDLYGASGYNGGIGGHVQALYRNTVDTNLLIYVGGSPSYETSRTGGWNGGGHGGLGYSGDGNDRNGGGGGGATDIRTTTSLSGRILVAGGGGGTNGGHGGKYPNNGNGHPYPAQVDSDGTWCSGGAKATDVAGGAGGVAPSIKGNNDYDNDGTYYVPCGGGGGGGYFGGGGGSSGVVNGKRGTSYTGVAGTAGSSGVGGNGGGKTSGSSGWSTGGEGGGGGGSSFIATTSQILSGSYDQSMTSSNDGFISVFEVISAPIIVSAVKDGDSFVLTVDKEKTEVSEKVEEVFYCGFDIDLEPTSFKKDLSNSVIVSDKPATRRFKLPTNISSGYHIAHFYATSADGRIQKTSVRFLWNDIEPTLTFNYATLGRTLFQGRSVQNAFKGTGLLSGDIPLTYETKLIIDGQEYSNIQKGAETSIYLPCLYDGLNSKEYTFKIKTRVGQLASGAMGHGREIWSKWFESDELMVYAPVIPLNKVTFHNKLDDKAIEKDTKLKLSWGLKSEEAMFSENRFEYILSLFKDGELLTEESCGQNTEVEKIMSYPHGENYQFGISILENGEYLSEMNFSDSFQIADINTGEGKVSLSDDLVVRTRILETFNKISILINGEEDFTVKENVNQKIPLWKLKSGNNVVEVKIFKDEKIYVKHVFDVFIYVVKDNISKVDTHNIKVSVSINDETNYRKSVASESSIVDLGRVEQEFESQVDDEVVSEITQKITVTKTEGNSHDLKILEVLGGLG